MKITPIGPRILIEKYIPEVKQAGLIITAGSDVDHYFGRVIAFGDDEGHPPIYLGDIIKYIPYSAKVIDPKQPNMLVIDEKDIIALVEL